MSPLKGQQPLGGNPFDPNAKWKKAEAAREKRDARDALDEPESRSDIRRRLANEVPPVDSVIPPSKTTRTESSRTGAEISATWGDKKFQFKGTVKVLMGIFTAVALVLGGHESAKYTGGDKAPQMAPVLSSMPTTQELDRRLMEVESQQRAVREEIASEKLWREGMKQDLADLKKEMHEDLNAIRRDIREKR